MSITPSTALLPMEDISQVLELQYKFVKRNAQNEVSSTDTTHVGGVSSGLVAVAATDDSGNLLSTRETVKNALNLNGKPSTDYMTKEDAQDVRAVTDKASKVYTSEVAMLRDELYQLRSELVKQGLIVDSGTYSGFQDTFKTSDKKYQYESLGGLVALPATGNSTVNTIQPVQWNSLKVGEWIILKRDFRTEGTSVMTFIVRITGIDNLGNVTFTMLDTSKTGIPVAMFGKASSSSPEPNPGADFDIYKTQGEYSNGGFSFSKFADNALDSLERQATFTDDSYPSTASITTPNTGFGMGFSIPSLMSGTKNLCALTSITAVVKSSASAGSLVCYVLEDTAENKMIQNLAAEEVGLNKRVLAKSQIISAAMALEKKEVVFNFYNSIDGSYPQLKEKKPNGIDKYRYMFVLVSEQAATNTPTRWDVAFSKSKLAPDVQTLNDTYTYVAELNTVAIPAPTITTSNGLGDMIFILSGIPVKDSVEQPYLEGLYTAKEVTVPTNKVARARLTLRIAREGLQKVTSSTKAYSNGEYLTFNEMKAAVADTDLVIIGDNFRDLNINSNDTGVILSKGAYIQKDDPIYRMGYKVYLRAYNKTWNTETCKYDINNEHLVEMPLLSIMRDNFKMSENRSDRLIFEYEFRERVLEGGQKELISYPVDPHPELGKGLPVDLNTFEIQVTWRAGADMSTMVNNNILTGRIYDFILSFDQTL